MAERIEGLSIGLDLDTLALDRGLTGLKDKLKTVNSEMKANLSAFDRGDKSIEKYQSTLNGLNKKLELQKSITIEAAKEYDKMVAEYGEGSKEADKAARAYNNQVASLNNLQRSVDRTKSDLQKLKEEQRIASSNWTKFGNAIEKAGNKLTGIGESFKGVGSNLTTSLSLPLAGLGALMMKSASDTEQSLGKMQAALGLSEGEARKLNDTARDLWEQGFGENIDEVANTMIKVEQNMSALSWATQEELQEIGKSASVLFETFGADVNDSTKTANMLITQFGLNSKEAFDMLTWGYQNGLDYSGEFLDSVNEYSPQFSAMGMSAEEMFSLFEQGAVNGAFNLDKVGDAVKEFNIRIKDGSKSTEDSMDLLSKGTQDLWKQFQNGEKTGKEVMDAIIGELSGMDDQVKANQIGVGLFGTQWEDLETDAIYALGNVNGELTGVEGSTEKAGKALKDNLGDRFQSVWRELQTALIPLGETLVSFAEDILPKVSSGVEKVSNWFNDLSPASQRLVVIIGGIAAALGPVITFVGIFISAFGKILSIFGPVVKSLSKASGLFKSLRVGLMAFTGPVGIAIGVITLLTTGFILLYKKSETFRNGVKSLVSSIKEFTQKAVAAFKKFWEDTVKVFNDLKKSTKQKLDEIVKWAKELPGRIGSAIKSTTSKAVNAAKNMASNAKNAISDWWNRVVQNAKDLPGRMAERIRNAASKVATAAKNLAIGAKDKVAKVWSDMVQGAKELPGKIGNGIKNMAGKAVGGVTALSNRLLRGLGKGVNGVIGGVNWVLGKVGVNSKISKWDVPQYATGTESHPGGPAIVGEKGRELAHVPGMGYAMLGEQGAQLLNLPKGTSVLPNKQTEEMLKNFFPAYAKGTGWLSNAWEGTKKVASKVKDTALDVWSYISEPGKLFNKALELFGVETPSFPGILKDMGVGLFNKAKDALKGFLKGKIENFGLGDVPTSGSGVQRWRGLATRALMMTGQFTKSNLERMLYQMQTESNGNPRAINLWDINAKRGTPSKGLMQVIDPTFRAYAHPGFNKNIWDPLSNMLASIRYAVSRYGSLTRAYRGVGYETGGLIGNDGLYRLAEGGYPEFVIPTDPARRTDAMKLLALAGKRIAGNKRPDQLPNVSGGHSRSEEISLLRQQVQLLTELVLSSRNIESKPVISEGDIGRAYERYDAKQSSKHSIFNGRVAY